MTGCGGFHARVRTAAVAVGVLVVLAVLPATAAAQVTIAPASHDFGEVVVGADGGQQFVLTNGTDDALENLAVVFNSSGPPGATLAFGHDAPLPATNCSTVVSVPPDGGTCTLEVSFAPNVPGDYEGTVVVTADGVPAGPTVQLSGTGIPPIEGPAALDFGTQPLATIGAVRTVTVTLNGPQTVGVARVMGTNRDDFLITSDDCSGITVADDATCELHLRFAPSAQGPRGATLVVPSGSSQATTELTGSGGALPQGPPGEDGQDGAPGAAGPQGPAGPQGTTGLPGADGANGANGANGAQGPAGPAGAAGAAAALGVSLPAALLTRRARLSGDTISLALRCPAGAAGSIGTVTLRTAGRLRGARRTLGTAAFGCAAGQTEIVELFVGSRLRRLLRANGRALGLAASILTRGDGSVRQTATALALAPARPARGGGGGQRGAGEG